MQSLLIRLAMSFALLLGAVPALAQTATGVALRTCYGYDAQGSKVSETTPLANLASCP